MTTEVVTEHRATPGKECWGSQDGYTFRYADGSTDRGNVYVVLLWRDGDWFGEVVLDQWEAA